MTANTEAPSSSHCKGCGQTLTSDADGFPVHEDGYIICDPSTIRRWGMEPAR